MDCRGTQEKLSEYRDGFLSPPEADAVSGHLSTCAECAAVAESVAALRERLRALTPDPAPPELLSRVREAIGKEAGGPLRTAGSGAAGSRPFFARRWLPLEAAAAVLLFASVYWYQRNAPPPSVSAPAVPSTAERTVPPAAEKGAPEAGKPAETADRRVAGASRGPSGRDARFAGEGATGAGSTVAAKKEAAAAPAPKARAWSPEDLPSAPAVRASTDSDRIVPASPAPPAAAERRMPESASAGFQGKRDLQAEGMREAQGEGRVLAAPPSRLSRPVPYGREVVLEVSPMEREGMEGRIAAAARRLGGGPDLPDGVPGGTAESTAPVRVLLPEPSAAAFLGELGRLGTIPPEGRPAAVDIPAGPRAGVVAYTVRIRVR